MSSTSDKTPELCAICNGEEMEHGPGKTMHAFTSLEGDLVTHAQKAKREAKPQLIVVKNSPVQGPIMRLIEVLGARGTLANGELMYVLGLSKEVEVNGTRLGTNHGQGDGKDRETTASE